MKNGIRKQGSSVQKFLHNLGGRMNPEGIWMTPEDIDNNAPLFGDEGLGLDSIDVLELIVLLERNYGIRLANPQEGKAVFQSIAVMADYVAANRTK